MPKAGEVQEPQSAGQPQLPRGHVGILHRRPAAPGHFAAFEAAGLTYFSIPVNLQFAEAYLATHKRWDRREVKSETDSWL